MVTITRIAFELFGIAFAYYDLVFLFGFLTTYIVLLLASKNKKLDISYKQVSLYLISLIFGVLIFAKAFHLIFWTSVSFEGVLTGMFKFWGPGRSYHGGFLGMVIITLLFSYAYKINKYSFTDILVLPALFFHGLLRIANFINQGIVGRISELPWCIESIIKGGCRHPSVLYESILVFSLFFILYHMKLKTNLRIGHLSWIYLLWLGVIRFGVDFFREGTQYYGLLAGQYLALIMIVIGLYQTRKYRKKSPY